MSSTVEATFRLLDRASPALDKIYEKATRLDEKLNATGRTMDKFAGEGTADLKVLDDGFRKMGSEAQKDTTKVSGSMEAMQRKIGGATSAAQRDIHQLNASLGLLNAQRASPSVELKGYSTVLSQIELLKREMDELSKKAAKMRAELHVTSLDASGGKGPSGGRSMAERALAFADGEVPNVPGAVGRRKGQSVTRSLVGWGAAQGLKYGWNKAKSGYRRVREPMTRAPAEVEKEAAKAEKTVAKAAKSTSMLSKGLSKIPGTLKMIALFSPVLEPLVGTLGALVGTLGGAASAAGVGGAGLIGAAIVGFGGMYAAAKPLFTQISSLNKSFGAYSLAVQQFGQNSQEARDAQKQLNATMDASRAAGGVNPERQLRLLQLRQQMGEKWRKQTLPGQKSIMGLMEGGLGTADKNMGFLSGVANQGAAGTASMGSSFLDKLDSPMFRRGVGDLANLFEKMSPQVGNIMGNAVRFFVNIADAAIPLVIDLIKYLDRWMGGKAGATSNIGKMSKMFKDWERDLRQVSSFMKEIGKWLLAFFGAGRGPGRGLLKNMTVDIRQSRKGIEEDGGAGLQMWFKEMVDRTKEMWSVLKGIAENLGKLIDTLGQIIGPFADLSATVRDTVSKLPGGSAVAPFAGPAVAAGAYFGGRKVVRGVMGKIFGAAPEAAAATEGAAVAEGAVAGGTAATAGKSMLMRAAPWLSAGAGAYSSVNGAVNNDYGGVLSSEAAFAQNFAHGATGGILPGATSIDDARAGVPAALQAQLGTDPTKAELKSAAAAAMNLLGEGGGVGGGVRSGLNFVPGGQVASAGLGALGIGGPSDADKAAAEETIAVIQTYLDGIKAASKKAKDIKKGSDISKGFNTILKHEGRSAAFANLGSDLRTNLKGGWGTNGWTSQGQDAPQVTQDHNAGLLQMASQSLAQARAAAKGHPKMKNDVRSLTAFIEKRFETMGIDIAVVNGKIYESSASAWEKTSQAMITSAEQARQEVHQAFTDIQQDVIGQLVALGLPKSLATAGVSATDSVTTAAGAIGTATQKGGKARGGIVPGNDLRDTQMIAPGVMAAGGERVVNQHQMADINRYLYPHGTSVDKAISGQQRPHNIPAPEKNAARGGKVPRYFKRGGSTPAADTSTSSGSGSIQPAADLAIQDGLSVSGGPGYGGIPTSGHAAGSLHYSGLAYDASGAADSMRQFFLDAASQFSGSINELFYDPMGYYYDNGARVEGAIGDHTDHVHIGFNPGGAMSTGATSSVAGAAAGTAPAPASVNVKRPKTALPGAPGAISQAATDTVAGATEKAVNSRLGAAVGGASAAAGSGVAAGLAAYNHSYEMHMAPDFGGETLPFDVVAQIAEAAGLPGVTFAQVAQGESGMRPGSAGTDPGGTHGYGMWAITDGFNDELIARLGGVKGMLNPIINSQAAKEIYDAQGIGAWYGTSHVTDPNAHYTGAVGAPGGSKQTAARGGIVRANRYLHGGSDPSFQGWFGRGGTFDTHGPAMIGVGEAGQERVTVTPKGQQQSSSGKSGPVAVNIGAIHVNRKGDVKKIVEEEFKQLGMDITILSGSTSHDELMR